MSPADPRPSDEDEPHDALRRIEERVQRVRDLGPLDIDRREDGRFHCRLEEPISELTESETRQALDTLESLSEALRRHLEETGKG